MFGSALNSPNAAPNSRKINSRAASKPPSRKIAPSSASNASASVDGAFASAVRFLAAAQNQMRAEVERARVVRRASLRFTSFARALVSGPSSNAGNFS